MTSVVWHPLRSMLHHYHIALERIQVSAVRLVNQNYLVFPIHDTILPHLASIFYTRGQFDCTSTRLVAWYWQGKYHMVQIISSHVLANCLHRYSGWVRVRFGDRTSSSLIPNRSYHESSQMSSHHANSISRDNILLSTLLLLPSTKYDHPSILVWQRSNTRALPQWAQGAPREILGCYWAMICRLLIPWIYWYRAVTSPYFYVKAQRDMVCIVYGCTALSMVKKSMVTEQSMVDQKSALDWGKVDVAAVEHEEIAFRRLSDDDD